MSYCPPQASEKNTCSTAPPDAPYNSPHNTNYAVYQVLPTNPYTGATNPTYTQYNSLPNNKPFTLNPQYPLNQGSNASQLVNIQEAKVVFNNVNTTRLYNGASPTAPVTFKSDRERMLYIQAQASLRVGLTPATYLS